MRKKRTLSRGTRAEGRRDRRRMVVAIALVSSVVMAGVIFGQRKGPLSQSPGQAAGPRQEAAISPASFDAASPSKEYIYAGGSLVATEEPAGSSCGSTISPSSASFASSAGTGSVAVTIGAGCGWTAVSNAPWIVITSGSSGTGAGTVNYSVQANTGGFRSGTMTIGGQTFTVNQAAPGCGSFVISPNSANYTASAGAGSVGVTGTTGCTWTATSNASWVTITSGASGSGNGTVNYSVAANTGVTRNGTMSIAGQTLTVTQAGCSITISPSSQSFASGGGTGSVTVTAGAGCGWTAASNASWITITAGSSGTGNGTVNYTVAGNSGTARSGTMTIAGQSFTVTQSGAATGGCDSVSMSPPTVTVTRTGGAFSVSVVNPMPSGCSWTATSNASWITITSGGSGVGTGTINYTVTAYSGGTVTRQGTITISTVAGLATHSVKQTP